MEHEAKVQDTNHVFRAINVTFGLIIKQTSRRLQPMLCCFLRYQTVSLDAVTLEKRYSRASDSKEPQ